MAYDTLKAQIADAIPNNIELITAAGLRKAALDTINSLGAKYQFGGSAVPDDNPGTPDYKVAYIVTTAGTYTNFGGLAVATGEIAVLQWDGTAWSKITILTIADNLTTADATKPLSAKQGVVLNLKVEQRAKKNGHYPDLTTGLAENLVDTKGQGTEQRFTRRTSCGSGSITGDGAALIKSIRGLSIVWNQMIKNGDFGTGSTAFWSTMQGMTAVVNNGVCALTKSTSEQLYFSQNVSLIKGHKYFFTFDIKPYNDKNITFIRDNTAGESYGRISITSDFDRFHRVQQLFVATADKSNASLRIMDNSTSDFQTNYVKNVMVVDLTLMGLDSIVETPEDFTKLFPNEYYENTYAGALRNKFSPKFVNNTASAIKTNGFNQWNEQRELGGIYTDNGQDSATSGYYRSKYIPVFPNATYYIKCPVGMNIFFYGKNKEYIGYSLMIANIQNSTFTIPQGAFFMRFRNWRAGEWPTYNNDVCLNLSWSGYRNGEYEQYWEQIRQLNLNTLTGKENGEGSSVVIFPSGMKSAGSVYDEIFGKKAFKRIGAVDAGNLTWEYDSESGHFAASFSFVKIGGSVACERYASVPESEFSVTDKAVCISGTEQTILVNDTGYEGDATSFADDMDGVMIYFELDTPEEYVLDEEINYTYRVADFGTEEATPNGVDEDGIPTLSAFCGVVKYNDDMTRQIARMPVLHDTTEGIDGLCAALASALGSALGGTLSITRGAYDEANKKYSWSVTFTSN